MSVQFKVAITKEILEHCKDCGIENGPQDIGRNCAVAIAMQDIFPNVYVTNYYIFPFGVDIERGKEIKIAMPLIAQQFIKLFDGFHLTPKLRTLLPEFEFVIDVPDEVIDEINIDEVRELIDAHKKTARVSNHLLIYC